MKVLLTGGAGYIGSHTAIVLAQSGHQIVLFDNLSNSSSEVVEKISQIVGRQIILVQGDVRDTQALIEVMQQHAIDAVIHFAGLKSVGESVLKPIDYYSNNVQGTISLLQAMQEQSVSALIFSSSATVYGAPTYLPLDEKHPTSATNPYGRSKIHVEEALADLSRSDDRWKIVCLRYFNPVGAHESGLIGENPYGAPNNLMPYIAQVAVGKLPYLNVFGDDYPTPDGTGVRDYIHVMDLAEGHAAALDYLAHCSGWHAVNLGTGKGYSVFEMIEAFERASGREVSYRVVPRRPGDVAACYTNPAMAEQSFKWMARRSIDDMCASTWRYELNRCVP